MSDKAQLARELWHSGKQLTPELCRDVAIAYIDHLDCEAERAEPITREWLKSIGFENGEHKIFNRDFMLIVKDGNMMLHVEGYGRDASIYRLPLPHITTRGQVLDLMRLLGVKP